MIRSTQWIITADERRARLYECRLQRPGEWHIEERAAIDNPWENYHEHHRPVALGRGPTANAAQHFASTDRDPDEEHRRFAHDFIEWMKRRMNEFSIARVEVFVAPRFLGLLRPKAGSSSKSIHLHEGEFVRFGASDLATHPAVVAALGDSLNSEVHARS